MKLFHTESTDMGKLYLNYPMIEAFYHMGDIPDPNYNSRTVTLHELTGRTYKQRVNIENRNRDYAKFAATREECNIVIKQNIEKGLLISGACANGILLDGRLILDKQLAALDRQKKMFVLCTCVYFIAEYNPSFLEIPIL